MSYFEKNKTYWEQGYPAENVDHPVYRGLWGRIIKPDFPHLVGGKLVDFGCGQGANTHFMHTRGFDVRGVDISETDISAAKKKYPEIADKFSICKLRPQDNAFYGFDGDVSVVMGIQAFYYFTDSDLKVLVDKLYASMKKGGLFYATMMGEESKEFFDNSAAAEDGLRIVNFKNTRLDVKDYCMSFVKDEADLKRKFSQFKPLHIGYYTAKFRSDEGNGMHWTFCGIKE